MQSRKYSGIRTAARILHSLRSLVGRRRQEEEAYLHACLAQSRDVRVDSLELQGRIKDRVSEYHLSPARANLLRGLDLDAIGKVLEIGAGCGPLTRFLGEKGMTVHAVERSRVQAELARMRCRDLKNVHVLNTEYHDLSLPASCYDVIFMIGVPLQPEHYSPASLRTFVRKLKKALRPGGILVAAVDTRPAVTFQPFSLGNGGTDQPLNDNFQPQADPVPDKPGWRDIFLEDNEACSLIYPFPDFRFPRVLLMDRFIAMDDHPYSLLYRVLRKNEAVDCQAVDDAYFYWKAMHASGNLAEVANSVLILISSGDQAIRKIAPFDFVHFSSTARKLEYRTCTVKLQGEGRVVKRLLSPGARDKESRNRKVRISELDTVYERGPLVAILWLEACSLKDRAAFETRFTGLLRDYYLFVRRMAGRHADRAASIDLLPSNLVAIAGQSQYKAIDQEWIYAAPFSEDFILFRALLWFGYHNRCALAGYQRARGWQTVRDFVEYGFASLSLPLESRLEEFAALEDGFHQEIALSYLSFSTMALLQSALQTDRIAKTA